LATSAIRGRAYTSGSPAMPLSLDQDIPCSAFGFEDKSTIAQQS
jgi:hypothetical protein